MLEINITCGFATPNGSNGDTLKLVQETLSLRLVIHLLLINNEDPIFAS